METVILIAVGLVALAISYYRERLPDVIGAHIKFINAALTAILPQLEGTENEKDVVIVIVGLLMTYAFPNDADAKVRLYGSRRR